MVNKIQERWISSRTRVYHLYKSVSFTEKPLRRRETGIKDGFEVNGKRISVWNILSWKTGLPFQKFRCSWKISTGTTQTVLFPLFWNRIFRKFFLNGKQPFLISFGDEILYSTANDPQPQMIPRPQMILDRRWSPKSTANDPERKIGMTWTQELADHGVDFIVITKRQIKS